MKKKILKPTILLLAIALVIPFSSCKKMAEEALSKEITINNKVVEFEVGGNKSANADSYQMREGAAEIVLYDHMFEINVAKELEKNGLSFQNIKSLVLMNSSLELVTTNLGVDMGIFKTVKLYFDDRNKLVAKADNIEPAKNLVLFSIVNGELLDKLKEDKLHIILTGEEMPKVKVKVRLKMNYKAKVSLVK